MFTTHREVNYYNEKYKISYIKKHIYKIISVKVIVSQH